MDDTIGIIFVGGPSKATRFRPLSFQIAKPLFPIAGVPMIHHHVKALVELGIRKVFLLGFYRAEMFSLFVRETSAQLKVDIEYILDGENPLGAARSLKAHESIFAKCNPKRVVILHCDVFCDFPLQQMVDFHLKHEALITILGKKMPGVDLSEYGVLVINDAGAVQVYVEHGEREAFVSDVINCGVYIMDFSVISFVGAVHRSFDALIEEDRHPDEIPIDMGDLFSYVAKHAGESDGPKANALVSYVFDEPWCHVKWPQDVLSASELICSRKGWCGSDCQVQDPECTIVGSGVFIDPTACVPASCRLGPNVLIGPGVLLGEGVRLREALLLDECSVGDFALISSCVVGWRSTIARWARLEGDPLSAMRRQRVTTLGQSVIVERGVHLRGCIVLPHKRIVSKCFGEIVL